MGVGRVLEGPENKQGSSHQIAVRQEVPVAAVQTVIAVVTHDEIAGFGKGHRTVVVALETVITESVSVNLCYIILLKIRSDCSWVTSSSREGMGPSCRTGSS